MKQVVGTGTYGTVLVPVLNYGRLPLGGYRTYRAYLVAEVSVQLLVYDYLQNCLNFSRNANIFVCGVCDAVYGLYRIDLDRPPEPEGRITPYKSFDRVSTYIQFLGTVP